MPQFRPSLAVVTFALAAAVTSPARADGVQVGARTGVQFLDKNALFVGADARLSFELSPLIVNLTFDHFFLKDRTLFQVGANALYDLPIETSFLYPYLGAGVGVTRFAMPETANLQEDSNGTRVGLNLIGGVRFEHVKLPVVRPFVQMMASLGPINLFTVGGGVLFELAGR